MHMLDPSVANSRIFTKIRANPARSSQFRTTPTNPNRANPIRVILLNMQKRYPSAESAWGRKRMSALHGSTQLVNPPASTALAYLERMIRPGVRFANARFARALASPALVSPVLSCMHNPAHLHPQPQPPKTHMPEEQDE